MSWVVSPPLSMSRLMRGAAPITTTTVLSPCRSVRPRLHNLQPWARQLRHRPHRQLPRLRTPANKTNIRQACIARSCPRSTEYCDDGRVYFFPPCGFWLRCSPNGEVDVVDAGLGFSFFGFFFSRLPCCSRDAIGSSLIHRDWRFLAQFECAAKVIPIRRRA